MNSGTDTNDLERVAFDWLVDDLGYSIDDASEKKHDVRVLEGTALDYAYELVEDCYNLESPLAQYFDYKAFSRDLVLGGDVAEFGRYVITNASEF